MPPEASAAVTGRCYCGRVRVHADVRPQLVAYCHCSDCRRVSGAPVAAFAAFAPGEAVFDPPLGPPVSVNPGVERWFCHDCGTPLAATFDYLPDQVYVPVGLLDQAAELPPSIHSHASSGLPWLHIDDDAERLDGSSRERLAASGRT